MFGGAKAASLGAKGIGKVASLMSAAAREGKDLNYVQSLFSNADDLIGQLAKDNSSAIKDIAKNAWDDLFGAVVESGAEASETKKTIFENLKRKAILENNGLPISKEQEAQLDKQASVGGAANFLTNLVTTGMVNNVVFKPLMKTKWLDDVVDNKAIQNELINPNFIGKKGSEYVMDKAAKNQKLYQKVFQNNIAKNVALEGGQELVQFASNDYFVNLLSEPSKESIEDIADMYDITSKNGMSALLKTGKNLSSIDAVQSAMIGGLIGGAAGALQDFSSKGVIDQNTQYAIDYANRNSLNNKDVTAAIKNFAKAKEYSQIADAAVKNGDRVTYETAKYLGFANYVNARVNMSKFEDVLADLKGLKEQPLEKFKEQFDLADYKSFNVEKRDKMINYAIDVANQIKSSQDKIMSNYGHKIAALEAKNPNNQKLLPFLTTLDALKVDYTKRESELIDKFKANGVDYSAFQKKETSAEKIAESQGKIGDLQNQLTELQANKTLEVSDKLEKITEISNQITKASNDLQTAITEQTYKDVFKKELTDEYKPEVDDKAQKFLYETFSKDLKDFVDIQTAKEGVIDMFSRITKDESYAEKVANKINLRKQDSEISKLFSISGNVINNPKVTKKKDKTTGEEIEETKDNFEFEEGESKSPESYREDYIKTGDVYQLNRKIYRGSAKGEAYEMFEVIDTKTSANPDGSLKGEVRISNNKGYKEWMDVRDFKRSIKPMGKSINSPIKMNNRSEEYKFYQEYKNRAIRFVRDGKTYIGKMSLPYPNLINDNKNLFTKASTYNVTFLNENNEKETIQGIKFNSTDYKELKNNIHSIEILSEELSTLLDLKFNVEGYISVLNSKVKTLQDDSIPKLKNKLEKLNNPDNTNIENLPKDLTDLLKDNIQLKIENNQSFIDSLKEAIKNLELYQDKDVVVNPDTELPKPIKEALDKLKEFRALDKQLSDNESRKLLAEKIKVLKQENEVLGQQIEGVINTISKTLSPDTKNIIDKSVDKIETVLEIVNNNEDVRNNNPEFLDLYKSLLAKEIEYKTAINEIEKGSYANIAKAFSTPQQPIGVEAIKLGELDALTNFWKFITNKGYKYSSGFGRTYSEDFQEDYNETIDKAENQKKSEKNEDIIKSIAPSDYTKINDNDGYQVEKQNFFKHFYKVPVDSKNPIQLEVEVRDDTIYLKFEHDKIPMVTTLAASYVKDSPLDKFRNKLKADYKTNLDNGKKTFISPNGKISLFEKGFENKPISEVFSDINVDIQVVSGTAGEKDIEYPVAGINYQLKNGRPYLINGKLGIVQPVVVGTLSEAKIKDKKGNSYTLTDTVFNYIKYLDILKDKVSDADYQKSIGIFYSKINSFLYTANFDSIGTDKGMNKGAIDIVERDGNWILGYLDADGKKQAIYMFDENGINPLAQEQLGRRLVNPKLESLGDAGFKYNEQFKPFLNYGIGADGKPYQILKDDAGYTYNTFLKESAGLKSNLAIQNIEDGKPTYFKSGYFTFDTNTKATNNENNNPFSNTNTSVTTDNNKSGFENLLKTLPQQSVSNQDPFASNTNLPFSPVDFGVSKEQIEAVKQSELVPEEPKLTTTNPIASSIGSKINNAKSKFGKGKNFEAKSLKVAGTNKLRGITKAELESARTRFEQNYGVKFDLVNGLINGFSWGRVTEAGDVLLSNKSPVGSDYHEEYHLVAEHILEPDELQELNIDARNKYGDKVTDYEIQEKLAEGFRMYALGYRGFTGKIAYYFNKLLNTLKSLVGIKDTPINQLYSDILAGKYYNKPIYKGVSRNSESLNYDEKQMILGHITKTVIELVKVEGLEGNRERFIQFVDDSFYREQMLNETLNPDDFDNDVELQEMIRSNNNTMNLFFNWATSGYTEHIEANEPLLASRLFTTYDNFDDLIKDVKGYFNNLLKTNIDEEITEEEQAATADIRKKGDAETDFFNSSLTKLRLLIVNESDGTVFGHLNPATFIGMIYNHIRDLNTDISTYENFQAGLRALLDNPKLSSRYGKEYIEGLRNIIKMLNIGETLPIRTSKHVVNLQNLLFEVFSKVENEFQIMKVIDNTVDGNKETARAFVNQTVEKQFDTIQKKVRSNIVDYLLQDKPNIPKINNALIAETANNLFGTDYFTEAYFSGSDTADLQARTDMFHAVNAIIDGKIDDSNKTKKNISDKNKRIEYVSNNLDKILDFSKSSIDRVVSQIATAEGIEKIFNIRNAEGSPQFSLSNYSSLHKKLEEYKAKENPVKSDLEFTGLALMNGIQTKGNEVEAITANKLNRNDILLYFIESVLKDGVLPYAFSGDKSTLLGIRAKGSILGNNTDYESVYNKLLDKEIAFIEAFDGKKPFEKMKLEYPLFEFLNDTNKKLYERLKNNPQDTREEAIKALIEHVNKKAADLKQEVIKITGEDLYSPDEMEKFYHVYTISIAEQTNELTGSLNFYSDFAKRAYAISSTKINLRLDNPFVTWYNENYSKGIYDINPNGLKSLVIDDVEVDKDYLQGLGDFSNAADAQGYMYYHSARFMLRASGRWNEKLDRIFKDLDRLENKNTLTQQDIDSHNTLVSELNEQVSVLKPQYFGYQDYNGISVPTFYKLSVLPLSKVVTQDKNIDAVRQLMRDKGIDLVMFASANKVGRKVENGTLQMYDKDGNFILGNNKSTNSILFEEEQEFGYKARTVKNASADATIAIAKDFNTAGEKLTKTSVLSQNKKYIDINFSDLTVKNEDVNKIINILNSIQGKQGNLFETNNDGVSLNIAGNGIYSLDNTQEEIDNFTYELLSKVINSPKLKVKVKSLRTGGQTGFDEAGAKAGIKLDIPTKILAPKNWTFRNKRGVDINNKEQFINRFDSKNQDINIEDYVQVSDWKYMGIQVEMPLAHETVTFGTQLRKLITESLPEDIMLSDRDTPYTRQELITKHENLILKKIESDTKKFQERFKLQDDFTFGENVKESDRKEFKKQLIEQATSREVPDSFIQSLRDNNSWDYIMNKSTLQKILNASIRNNIITQKMPGDAKAMVSSVGFEGKGKSIAYSNRLKFYEKGVNGSDAIEVLLPYQYIETYKKYVTFEDGIYKLSPDTPKELTDLVGYRIPTQGHASIDKLRIKGFLPQDWGNAIVVPFELSKKAGSDFDIDKLNIFFPKLKDGKYDKSAIENEILSFYNDVLSSPQYRELLLTSIDNSEIKDIIKGTIEPIQGTAKVNKGYLMFDPVKAVDRRYSFMTAKSTLGSVALHATHHAESQKHRLGIIAKTADGATNKRNGVSLIDSLNLFESGREITKKNKFIIPLYEENSSLKRNGKPVKISDILSQFMNATVDAAKDDYITSANFDLTTVNVALMLIRMGVHPKEVLTLISNKSVKKYADLMKAKNDLTYDTGSISDKISDLKTKAKNASYTKLDSSTLESSLLKEDYGMLKLYLDLEQFSNILSDVMNLSNFDTKGNGKSIEENEYRQRKYELNQNLFKDYISNYESSSNPKTSFQSAFREVAFKANNFTGLAFGLNKLYNTESVYKNALNKLAYDLPFTSSDEITYKANRFKQMFLTALLQYNVIAKNKGKEPKMDKLYESIKKNLPDESYLKNKLQFVNNADGKSGLNAIILNGGASLSVDEANRITEAFEQLYRNAPQVAKDLVTYSIFQSGVINSPVTIYHVIPDHIIKEVALMKPDSNTVFDDLLNQAQSYSKEDVIKKLVQSVDTKLLQPKSKYNNKMLSLLAQNNINNCPV